MIKHILQNFYTPIYIEPGTYSCKLGFIHQGTIQYKEIFYSEDSKFITNGVISNYEDAKQFFNIEIAKLAKISRLNKTVGYIAYVLVHSKITDVELSALEDSLKENKFRMVKFFNESLSGIPKISISSNSIAINFGYTTTEMVFIKNRKIILNSSLDFGCIDIVKEISKYIEQKYNSKVSEKSIIKVVKDMDLKSKKTLDLLVKDVLKNKSIHLKIQASELYPIVKNSIDELTKIISTFMEDIDIEEFQKVEDEGLFLTGGLFQNNSYLSYLGSYITQKINFTKPREQIENFIEVSKVSELEFSKDII